MLILIGHMMSCSCYVQRHFPPSVAHPSCTSSSEILLKRKSILQVQLHLKSIKSSRPKACQWQTKTQILNHSPRNFQKSFNLIIRRQVSTYFLMRNPNHPVCSMTQVKIATLTNYGRKTDFMQSRDQCSAKREKRLHFSVA